ncbi:MAG: MBL fold metallo-hydrolase [Woeseiaceae bacterium]
MMRIRPVLAAVLLYPFATAGFAATTEFCLDGEFDLGARYQGHTPRAGEFYPARWCVTTDDASDRVLLSMSGNSNPDMAGGWTVAFIPPDLVRIVNRDSPPDIEFRTSKAAAEAARSRMLDPRHSASPSDPIREIRTSVDLPLRGRVPVTWTWRSLHGSPGPRLEIDVDGVVMFRGTGSRRILTEDEAATLWAPTPGADPVDVPGDRWPSRVVMELVNLADDVYLVQGVRTGFHHMVVATDEGLVVADAPAGWVELQQFPPADLVPGLGVSGLSEGLVDFLAEEFPGVPIRAVVLTHHHDDHAGGARAFAAAGATIYAPGQVARFLGDALNRESMPGDRLTDAGHNVLIQPVADFATLSDPDTPVTILNMGASPHVIASLGVLANGYFFQSDLHVPNSESDVPRSDRVETECWFAGWAVNHLTPDTVVINTHSLVQTPVSRLAKYLESDSC